MKCKYLLFAGVFLLFQPTIFAKKPTSFSSATLRSDCIVPTAYTQLRANKIRATLHASGDMWWAGGNTGGYIVPNVGTGSRNVSAIYVGAIWMGGFDPAGNLKLAAQSYGTAQGQTDYWSGPLNSTDGTTELSICNNWDKLFKVRKSEIETHLRLFGQGGYTESQIPKALKAWPAKGNPYFQNTNGFELPNNGQALADFFDQDNDDIYDPLKGDFPVLDVGCADKPVYPEEMVFWIFNDNGGTHTESNADAIKAEFHMTAFGFQNQDVLDYSTFYNLKFFNRAAEDFTNAYIGLWADPDLGCSLDDYLGCDSTRNLAYIYNSDQYDGETGCTCSGGTNTYCDEIPIVGFDFLRGTTRRSPRQDANGNVLIDPVTQDTIFETIDNGMSSFIFTYSGTI
ncbi:MAG TPA: hypothetical protein PKC40_12065, partial [Saprospiraceae bacterium]|nr:hypothetical protein [Saprospiraceae bacterium]